MLENSSGVFIAGPKNKYISTRLQGIRSGFDFSLFAFVGGFSFAMVNGFAQVFGVIGGSYDTPLDYILVLIAPLLFLFSSLAHLQTSRLRDFRPFYRLWILVLFICVCILFVIGVLKGNSLRIVIQHVIIWVYFFASVLIGAKSANWVKLDRLLLFWFGISVLLTMWYWLNTELLTTITNRSILTTSRAYIAWNLLFSWPYLILTLNHRGRLARLLTLGGFGTFFILSIAFQKRTAVVQLILLFVLMIHYTLILQKKALIIRRISRLLVITILVVAITLGVAHLTRVAEHQKFFVHAMQQRFQESGSVIDTFLSNDRLTREPSFFFEGATDIEIIFGKGFGGTMLSAASLQREVGVVHNGLVQVALEGGAVLTIIWMFGWVCLILNGLRNRDMFLNRYYAPAIILGGSALMGFGNILQLHPGTCFTMLCAGRCMARGCRSG